ncbi:MAG: hypothetical protein PHP69_01905 [Candidatus Omnitrophica bacterium]|nr:hypothetical protein [Candidatus Omnitrophota bacterium]MDD5080796.1 hypothetical protein [Candidatus Omnitrophota bacterium]MDD5440913.1 hypothetical protein [Candidatus Omnitrophota bacterium]
MKKSIVLIIIIGLSLVAAIYAATTLRLTYNRYRLIKNRIDFIELKNAAHSMLTFVRGSIDELYAMDRDYSYTTTCFFGPDEDIETTATISGDPADMDIFNVVIVAKTGIAETDDVQLTVDFDSGIITYYDLKRIE